MNASLPKHLHVIGICGVATSAIAIAFKKKGVKVTGSDKGFFPPVSIELEQQGIPFYAGWHPEKMIAEGVPDAAMVGNASGSQNPETAYCREHNISLYSYPELLGKYFIKEHSVVCAGTWGKTSSSALLSFIFKEAKLDPTYMFGGLSLSHESSAQIGNSDWSILEGDEYRTSPTDSGAKFFHYKPTHLLLTAVFWDHADMYPSEDLYIESFKKLVSEMSKDSLIVACADNEGVDHILNSYSGKIVRYGRSRPDSKAIQYEYKNVSQSRHGLKLTITHQNKSYNIESPMIGLYQSENITGCFAMACESGIQPEVVVNAIKKFDGMKRRMHKRVDGETTSKGITVIDDIAHSPEKANSALQTLKSIYDGKIIAIFEPNIGNRQKEIIANYDKAFAAADEVIVPRLTKLKVSEDKSDAPLEGNELATIIGKTHAHVSCINDDKELIDYLVKNTKNGDVIAFLGSHGFRGMIEEIVKRVG